jgi:hypothetical protein
MLVMFTLMHTLGCQSWMNKDKEKNNHFAKETKRFKELLEDPERPRLVGEVAAALGMYAKHYDTFGLVGNLPGTGGIVKPGMQRDWMLGEMRSHDVDNPEQVLDSPTTALVKLRTYINPGDIKGDVLDMDVEVSTECPATDLMEGMVFEARLREMGVQSDGKLHSSNDKALGSGEIVILPTSYTKKQEPTPTLGVAIGGARLLESQQLGLRIEPDYRHVIITKAIEKAVNARFFYNDSNKQKLVAEGKNDWHIVLTTVPKYKFDPAHFMSVILATGFGESPAEQQERLLGCKKLLTRRETARRAAVELEAIGNAESKSVLIDALGSSDTEIRFHSAYSLAYMDNKDCIPVLMELARYEPAFRPLCLIGLAMNEDSLAREGLEQLLQESEPELRFGAFWAIRHRNPADMTVVGEKITTGELPGQSFQLVQIPSSTPLVAVSLQQKKEIVLFGNATQVRLASAIAPTPALRLSPAMGEQVKISKRQTTGELSTSTVNADIISILKGLGTVQANYNDVVHTIDWLSSNGGLSSPVALNPRPFAGREYQRKNAIATDKGDDSCADVVKIDNSSVGGKKSNQSGWWTPTSWWKPSKPTSEAKPATTVGSGLAKDESTKNEFSSGLDP